MKKIFEYIGLFSLACFSFFLTDKAVSVVQEVDNIMIEIKSHYQEYEKKGENATVKDNTIVPGLPAITVDIQKSYEAMKQIGTYDENYYVFHSEKPAIHLTNNFDKYIIHGNPKKRMVSIILILDKENLSNVLDKIGEYPVSFVISSSLFDSQESAIERSIKIGNFMLFEQMDQPQLETMHQKLSTLGEDTFVCYNPEQNQEFLNLCAKHQYYTIRPEKIITKKPLQSTKQLLSPGAFLVFQVNSQFYEEFPNIISYIESHGYTISSLQSHLKED